MGLSLPPTATVYTFRGAGAPLNQFNGWLSGLFDRYTMVPVNYPASMNRASIATGVEMVEQIVTTDPGPIVFAGQSQGCQVLTDWILKHNGDQRVRSDITFVLTGNPVRNPTGQLVGAPVVGPLGAKGVATPADSRWPVIDVARRGDPFAIKAGSWWNLMGNWYGKLFIHPRYGGVNIYDPGNQVEQNGNITLVTTG